MEVETVPKRRCMNIFVFSYKSIRKLSSFVVSSLDFLKSWLVLKGNGCAFSNFRTNGVPYVMVARGGFLSIGKDFKMNNGIKGNPIGCYERCTFFVDRKAKLIIGNNVGISQAALISYCSIKIGDNVKIGGGVSIYTTDFHSLNPEIRKTQYDLQNRCIAPVIIEDNVFIGAKCIILKGVTIGQNSIVGAGSVVTKSIPADEIWGGNPAKFIRKL